MTLSGCAIMTASQRFRPVLADLEPWPADSTIRFASADSESPWSAGGLDRVPVPVTWPHVFTLRLPPILTDEQLATRSGVGFRELRELLYWIWDPIGVSYAFPRTANEYDTHTQVILGRLHRGDQQRDFVRYLRDCETELLGERRSDHASLERLADRLIDWYEGSLANWLEHLSDRARTPLPPRS